jgi:hypothetical protein
MGCDIIMHSQIKTSEGRWVWYDTDIYTDRNYIIFGILDGTRRTEFHPIAENKGFPEDSEDKLKPHDPSSYDHDCVTESGIDLGYAGISYLSLTELKSFDWKQKIPRREEPYDSMEGWTFVTEVLPYLEAVAETHGGPDNVRVVFGYSV